MILLLAIDQLRRREKLNRARSTSIQLYLLDRKREISSLLKPDPFRRPVISSLVSKEPLKLNGWYPAALSVSATAGCAWVPVTVRGIETLAVVIVADPVTALSISATVIE